MEIKKILKAIKLDKFKKDFVIFYGSLAIGLVVIVLILPLPTLFQLIGIDLIEKDGARLVLLSGITGSFLALQFSSQSSNIKNQDKSPVKIFFKTIGIYLLMWVCLIGVIIALFLFYWLIGLPGRLFGSYQ